MLIWAGSKLFDDRNVFDFRANTNMDGEARLSFIVDWDLENEIEDRGHGVILDKHYQVENDVVPVPDVHDFNMHEFKIMDGGETVLTCLYRSILVKLTDFGRPEEESWVVSGGFAEYNITSNELLAQWNGLDHIPILESNFFHAWDAPQGLPGWDYTHANGVDKNSAGDYIISMRFTNTIYGVSSDGRVQWRLGGERSDFDQDFTFSKQHDVNFISSSGTNHVISLLNNASDEQSNDEDVSSVLYIALDTVAMTARVIKRVNRPDGGLTRLRGSAQTLPNENIFIGWSDRGYQSEHAPDGDVLMTARFASGRFNTYRAYKSEFVGRPLTPPDVVATVYGTSDTTLSTVIYVSWNGATDVVGWNFYAQASDYSDPVLIGHTEKTEFETMYVVDGYMDYITVEAVGHNSNAMMSSAVHRSEIPHNWQAAGFVGSKSPSPHDPNLVLAASQNAKEGNSNDATNGTSNDATNGTVGLLIFILVVCAVVGGLATAYHMIQPRYIRSRKARSYQHVPSGENALMAETHQLEAVPE